MAKGNIYTSSHPDNPPDWYWVYGLHDACILNTESFEFPFDYNRFIGDKNSYNRNLLRFEIDAENALCDTAVKEIRFFNYKILSDDISLEDKEDIWWLADRLVDHGKYYTLEIDLYAEYNFTLKIKFERAEVDRK